MPKDKLSPAMSGLVGIQGGGDPQQMLGAFDLHNFVPQATASDKFDIFQGTPWGQFLDTLPRTQQGGLAISGLRGLPRSPMTPPSRG